MARKRFRVARWHRRLFRRRRITCPPDETESLDSYGRSSNPTWRQLESALAELEGAAAALTFGSGMAAITSALRVLAKPGTTLVVPADGYYQVRRYAREYLAPQGITVVEAKCADIIDAASGADVVLAETPSTPAWTSSICTVWR